MGDLLNEAALLAARENRREIKIYDIDEAIDRVIMGPAKRSRKYTENEKRRVSYPHHKLTYFVGSQGIGRCDFQQLTVIDNTDGIGYLLCYLVSRC